MDEEQVKPIPKGAIVSADLTVANADGVRDFYKEVMGWEVENMEMEDGTDTYADYVMKDEHGGWIGGVCHKRGPNKDLPPQWIVYINVADISKSLEKCKKLGGKILKEAKNEDGTHQYALIQDPAGAIMAVTQA